MTKTLTKQWREGTLENGFYYVKSGWSTSIETRYLGNGFFEGNIEVLAPVPSYEEFKRLVSNSDESSRKALQLEKKLAIATKALKKINRKYRFTVAQDVVYKALKEMKGVK